MAETDSVTRALIALANSGNRERAAQAAERIRQNRRPDMFPEATVTIPEKRYLELLQAEADLRALEDAGVDNWPGRDEAEWVKVSIGEDGEPAETPI